MMLESIHTEHGYINRLLNILQQKLVAIENGQPVNYCLIKDIVEYLAKARRVLPSPERRYSLPLLSGALCQERRHAGSGSRAR